MSNQATLTLNLSKMAYLQTLMEIDIATMGWPEHGEGQSYLAYKKSILAAIESAIAHAEITE